VVRVLIACLVVAVTGAAAKSAPDGYTLAILSTIHAANQSFYRNLRYSMANDFVPVVEIGISPTLWYGIFAPLNIRPVKSSPEEFAARVKAEIGRWAETVRKAGIQPQE